MRIWFSLIAVLCMFTSAQAAIITPAFGKWSSAGGSVDAGKQGINTIQVEGARFSKPGGKPTMFIPAKGVNVLAFLDGQGGRPALAAWIANPYGVEITTAVKAAAATGKNVYFPGGYPYVFKDIHPKNNQVFYGDVGAGMFPSNDNLTIWRLPDGANTDMFIIDAGVKYVRLQDAYMDGRSAQQTGTSRGVYVVAVPGPDGEECQMDIERMTVYDFNGDAVYIGNFRRAVRVSNSHIMSNKGRGVDINASDCAVEKCAIGLNTSDGIRVNNWVANIQGNGIFWNLNGINITSIGNLAQIGFNGIDRNYSHGIFSYGSNGIIVGNVFHVNSQTTTGAKNDINIDGTFGSTGTVIVANTFDTEAGSAFNAGYNIAVFNGATITHFANSATAGSHTIAFLSPDAALMTAPMYGEAAIFSKLSAKAAAGSTADLLSLAVDAAEKARVSYEGYVYALRLNNPTAASNASIQLPATGTTIIRDVADGNSALAVNLKNASSTGLIADFKFVDISKAWIDRDGFLSAGRIQNIAAAGNASIQLPDTGPYIVRNIADGNAALTVNQAHASSTGPVAVFQHQGVAVSTISKTGVLTLSAGGSANKAICWKGDGKTLGYCSTVIAADGSCTCN